MIECHLYLLPCPSSHSELETGMVRFSSGSSSSSVSISNAPSPAHVNDGRPCFSCSAEGPPQHSAGQPWLPLQSELQPLPCECRSMADGKHGFGQPCVDSRCHSFAADSGVGSHRRSPELHPGFRELVDAASALGVEVIDRCNLTILTEPGHGDLAKFLADRNVTVIASLPCYSAANVDQQRGDGVFERSLEGLRQLNSLGYGAGNDRLQLHLVYNPQSAVLPRLRNRSKRITRSSPSWGCTSIDCSPWPICRSNVLHALLRIKDSLMPIKRFSKRPTTLKIFAP